MAEAQRLFHIRKAAPADLPGIEALARQIWPEAYAAILEPAQIAYMLDRMYAQPALEAAVADGHQFLMAEAAAKPVGFAGWGMEDPGVAKLHKLYVLDGMRKTGVGRALLKAVEAAANSAGAKALILAVNRQNPALHFYQRTGFIQNAAVDVDIGAGYWMNDYILAKPLR